MTRFFSISSLGLVIAAVAVACGNNNSGSGGTGGTGTGAVGGGTSGGSAGMVGSGGTGNTGTGGTGNTGTGGTGNTGTGGSTTGGTGNTGTGGSTTGGTGNTGPGGSAGSGQGTPGGSAGVGAGGGAGTGAGTAGMSGSAGSAGGTTGPTLPPMVTSASGAYWQTSATLMESTATATVTINDTTAQTWDGFGGAFNEIGWKLLTTTDLQTQALTLLFSAKDGANFAWGRIPMGASDYATSRYTCDDTGQDPAATSDGSNRPAADTAMANFTLARDMMMLIPYIKGAQGIKPELRFWASPWTPPVWMKTGYKTDDGNGGTVKKPSYYDGGNVITGNTTNLQAYAKYYTNFVNGYAAQNIKIEIVSPQNEPGYDQNYPSALWDKATYVTWVGILGQAMQALNPPVKVMLGTLSNAGDNNRSDLDISTAVLADSTAKGVVSVVGAQWGVLDKVIGGTTFGNLPVWATEHRCGNYPWCKAAGTGCPAAYNSSQAPNDQAYGEETWGYIRDAITKGKVTSYSAWNMVLDKSGLGIDTSRDWKQDSLLVVDGGKVNATPAYYVFRHFSQYVQPTAKVLTTSGGDAIGFKNPDGSVVAVMFNSGAANSSYVVALGGKKFQVNMPSHGWATVMYKPS